MRPRAPWLMRAQDYHINGERVLPKSARRHRHLIVQLGPIPRRPRASRVQAAEEWPRHELGVGWHGLYERPADLCDGIVPLKVRGRRHTDVGRPRRLLPGPPRDICQGEVCVGSGGMLSRIRRIFPIFHNSFVKTARFRWFRSPKGLDEHGGHGKDVHACPRLRIPPRYVGYEPMGGWYGPQLAPTHPKKDGHLRKSVLV